MIINKEQIDKRFPDGHTCKELIVSYIDTGGQVKYLTYDIPESELFAWHYSGKANADPIWRSYDHKFVKKVPTKTLNEYRMNEILSSFGKVADPLFGFTPPITWYCDIETYVDEEGFPKAETARTPINTIALTRFPKSIVWGRKPLSEKEIAYIQNKFKTNETEVIRQYQFEYRYFPNEADMILDFLKFIMPIPHITGWNFLGYDWPYIYNRCNNLNIDPSFVSPSGHFWHYKVKTKQGTTRDVMLPMHKIISDYMMIFQKWDQTIKIKENYKLDWISEQELGYKKVEHKLGFEAFYEQEYPDYVFYNAVDTILVEQIDKKAKTANIWYTLTGELKTELMMQFSTVKPTEVVMTNFCYPDHEVIPVKKSNPEDGEYPGAFVWPSQPGIYKFIGGGDFASLYPTTQRQFNISPETYKFTDKLGTYVPKSNEIKCKSGAVFTKDFDGLLPRILTYYFKARKHSKAQRKQVDKEYEFLKAIYEKRKGINKDKSE